MKIINKIFFVAIVILLYSCTADKYTNYSTIINNSTQHSIFILHYVSGAVYLNDTIKLYHNDNYEYAKGHYKGEREKPGFINKYGDVAIDSIIVIFDNNYMVSHYRVLPPNQKSEKYHLYESSRHILNPYSYEFIRIKSKKKVYTNTHTYSFTEDDYNYAKE